MSCPNLEKGWIPRCRAFGKEAMIVASTEMESSCFSGEFSECSFLSLPLWGKIPKAKVSKNSAAKIQTKIFPG